MKLFLLLLVSIIFSPVYASDQNWRKIVPLTSNCDDIKNIFEVKECSIPLSTYKFSEYTVAIIFSDGKDKWNVPKGTVLQVLISLRELIEIEKYLEENKETLDDFEITPVDDLPDYQIYTNRKKGIELTVNDGKWIQNIVLLPPNRK